MSHDTSGITGEIHVVLTGPDGEIKAEHHGKNIITAVGDQYYAGRAALASSLPAQVTGMKLGTGSVTGAGNLPAKTGTGAALTGYLAGSNKANDSGFPTASGGVVTWKRTYAPGEATSASPVTEVVLVTEAIANDDTSTAAETIARAAISGVAAKAAGDTLTITWTHTLLGA